MTEQRELSPAFPDRKSGPPSPAGRGSRRLESTGLVGETVARNVRILRHRSAMPTYEVRLARTRRHLLDRADRRGEKRYDTEPDTRWSTRMGVEMLSILRSSGCSRQRGRPSDRAWPGRLRRLGCSAGRRLLGGGTAARSLPARAEVDALLSRLETSAASSIATAPAQGGGVKPHLLRKLKYLEDRARCRPPSSSSSWPRRAAA